MKFIGSIYERVYAEYPGKPERKPRDYFLVVTANPIIEIRLPRKLGKWLKEKR